MSTPRPDTRVLVGAPIATDLGQYAANLVASGLGAYEPKSARTALDGASGRAVELLVDIDAADSGILVAHGFDTGDQTYSIEVQGGAGVEFQINGAPIITIGAPGAGPGARSYLVAWSTEANPATTGPADELRSVAMVYDFLGDALAWEAVTHPLDAANPLAAFSIGGAWDGATLTIPYTRTLDAARISDRYHSRVEVREHFVAQTPAPTLEGILAVERPVAPLQVAEAPAIVGPAYQAAAARMAAGRNRHRLCSSIVQMITPDAPANEDEVAAPTNWVRDLGDGYQTHAGWLWRRRIPRHVTWIHAKIHLSVWSTNGFAPDLVEVQLTAANAPPNVATETATQLVSRDVEDGGPAGIGELISFEPVFVHRDGGGYTWLYLSGRTDGGSGAGNAAYKIRGLSIAPLATEIGLEAQPPNPWGP